MATSKKFSELPAASSVGNGDLFAIAHEDALAETGYVSQKLTAAQAGQKVNGDTEYPTSLPSFPTGSQNPFDALEKLNADIEALYPVNTASGSIANFTTSLSKPLVGLSSTIVAQQAGTGTPSPSNPRSISGVSSVSFTQQDSESTTIDTFTIALGQTVYGGVLDAKNGKLVVTHVYEELGSLTWGLGTGGTTRFVANPTHTAKAPSVATIQADVISDIFKTVSSKIIFDGTDDYEIAIHTNGAIWVRDTDYSDKDAFKTAMANHYVCYELATPVEITGLTPDNFTTFAGEQNIFADSGDISVSFKQGIQEYIDAKIAETQALIL